MQQHAVRESSSHSFSLPPWTTIGVEFVAPGHLSPRRSIVRGNRDEGQHDMYAPR